MYIYIYVYHNYIYIYIYMYKYKMTDGIVKGRATAPGSARPQVYGDPYVHIRIYANDVHIYIYIYMYIYIYLYKFVIDGRSEGVHIADAKLR